MTQNLLVTGGCGFVGTNSIRLVMEALSYCRNINLVKLSHVGILWEKGDILSSSRQEKYLPIINQQVRKIG